MDDLDEVVESGAALGRARGEGGPDAFGLLASALAAGPLGNPPVNRHETDGQLGEVVGRHIPLRLVHDRLACLGQRRGKGPGFHRIVAVDHVEQRAQTLETPFAVRRRGRVGQRSQEVDLADEMRQTELHPEVAVLHVFAIRREIVAPQDARELPAQQLEPHLRTA